MPLTPKQQRFVEEYLLDLNASAAYQRAGYQATGNAAETGACRLLRNAQIQEAIAQAQQRRSQKTETGTDYVLRRLKEEAELMGEGSSHAARVAALKLIGLHNSMFVHRVEHSGERTLRIKRVIVDAADLRRNGTGNGVATAPGAGSVLPK